MILSVISSMRSRIFALSASFSLALTRKFMISSRICVTCRTTSIELPNGIPERATVDKGSEKENAILATFSIRFLASLINLSTFCLLILFSFLFQLFQQLRRHLFNTVNEPQQLMETCHHTINCAAHRFD